MGHLRESPAEVSSALYLLIAVNLFSIAIGVLFAIGVGATPRVTGALVALVVVSGLVPLALVLVMARGHGWALWAYLVLFALAVLQTMNVALDDGWLNLAYLLVYCVIDAVGIVLLLTRQSRTWFKSMSAARRQSVPAP